MARVFAGWMDAWLCTLYLLEQKIYRQLRRIHQRVVVHCVHVYLTEGIRNRIRFIEFGKENRICSIEGRNIISMEYGQ